MGKLKLESYLLNMQRPIKSHILTYTYDKLKSEINEYVPEGDMIITRELINWIKEYHDNVSLHAFDSRYKKIYFKYCS